MPDMEAMLAAIEQAKAALDQIEAEIAKRGPPEEEKAEGEKPPMPMDRGSMPGGM